ncbi:MLX-interacting protein-like isoform X1 [Vespula pensylvanica]|uniref:MLX-interacting protein-like isoform X1 n=1 Tax=Vespula pensylvanica TaxID=30213 RepID=UPI001CB9DD44|nr:MLX-interacting protein-like isoform X1 [Vespula pensylvanica]
MQAGLIYRKPSTMMTSSQGTGAFDRSAAGKEETANDKRKSAERDSRETIHSGHFMVSDFEAEAQDDEDELAVPVPDEENGKLAIMTPVGFSLKKFVGGGTFDDKPNSQQLSIETSLNKLFQCMSLAYRQKLTSPKWNRFKGIRLRWKDKIRLNNVIWRCWHMQFILKQNTLVCQFASPLDVDTHNKPEAVVLEGKYWKRKLAAVTAEYKKWRMFYRNKILGWTNKDGTEVMESMDTLDWSNGMETSENFGTSTANAYGATGGTHSGESMMVDEDYMELMTDTLFSTISSNQPIYFPDPREIARGASLADFIQPSLGPLQPNLDDFMDTLEPLQEFLNSKLPPVPEEEDMFRGGSLNASYPDIDLMTPINQMNELNEEATSKDERSSTVLSEERGNGMQNLHYTGKIYNQSEAAESSSVYRNDMDVEMNYRDAVEENFERSTATRTTRTATTTTTTSTTTTTTATTTTTTTTTTTSNGQSTREKIRQENRRSGRMSRVIQQTHQQQHGQRADAYRQVVQAVQAVQSVQTVQRNSVYEQPSQQQSYAMEVQAAVQLAPVDNQIQVATLNDQSVVNATQISSMAEVQNLVTAQQNFAQSNAALPGAQQRSMRSLPPTPPMSSKPYKIVQPQPNACYKLSNIGQNFNTQQQCKFAGNNFKTHPAQQVVSVPTQQPTQSPILLQCRSSGLDLTLQPTKLVAQSIPTTSEKEVFAVPKYQMKARNRSRSSSSLIPPRMNQLPLASAVSDPALNLNNNVLLAHLLTNNTSGICTMNAPTDKIIPTTNQSNTVKHILPILPPTASATQVTTAHHIATPVTVQAIQTSSIQASQHQQQGIQSSCGQQILLNANNQTHPSQNSPGSPKDHSNAPSPQALSLSPLHSPMSIGSPLSPTRNYVKGESERGQYKEQRRVGHIHAEQKRRYNIKNGFDMLHSLIPQLNQNPNAKLSKAAMLQKGADYIKQLRAERNQLKEEMDSLRHQIECLNTSISNCQSMLPATGAPVSRHRTNKMKEMFDEYVRTRTRENWKFWIFSILLEPLMLSFNTSVSTASIEDLYRSTILWVEQHCSLVDLRPAVLNSLRYLCTATDILADPGRLPEEALAAVNRTERRRSIQ